MTGASSTEASRRLSLETMRDDLARMLGMPAESISDDADLIGLGLDSVRAMRLVAQWRRRGGGVRFADLASAHDDDIHAAPYSRIKRWNRLSRSWRTQAMIVSPW